MTEDVEEWRPVLGWPYYEVSDHGRVRSIDRTVADRNGRVRKVPGRQLRPWTDGKYPRVVLMHAARQQKVRVHTLVLEAFVGPRPPGLVALHGNDIGTDNRVGNLRWGTPSENQYDRVENGHHHYANRSSCALGHVLMEPNLVAAAMRKGSRECRSCHNARAARQKWKPHYPAFDLQEVADRYYERWTPKGRVA